MNFVKKAAPWVGVAIVGVAGGLYLATTSVGQTILGAVGLKSLPPAAG